MNFARKQLEKYGWTEGKGLGKNEDGISSPVKASLKFDNTGIGFTAEEPFTNNWWERLFDSAAQNIDIAVDDKSKVMMKTKSEEPFKITTKRYTVNSDQNHLEYGTFKKSELKSEDGVEDTCKSYAIVDFNRLLTDEKLLLAACEGRTAHKGARHGLKLSGKLSRLEKQEKMLLKKMKNVSLSDENERNLAEKKLKKLKKQKHVNREKYTPILEENIESTSSCHIKKKSKKRKSVSFNEMVTEIYPADLDTSFDSERSSIRDENSNEPTLEGAASGSDEGIEQDVENNNDDIQDNHRSFEEGQFNVNDLSKAERKKLNKKRKLEKQPDLSKGVYFRVSQIADLPVIVTLKDEKRKKRKLLEEHYSKTDSADCNKSRRNRKKKRKQKRVEEELQINSISTSLDNCCRISGNE